MAIKGAFEIPKEQLETLGQGRMILFCFFWYKAYTLSIKTMLKVDIKKMQTQKKATLNLSFQSLGITEIILKNMNVLTRRESLCSDATA